MPGFRTLHTCAHCSHRKRSRSSRRSRTRVPSARPQDGHGGRSGRLARRSGRTAGSSVRSLDMRTPPRSLLTTAASKRPKSTARRAPSSDRSNIAAHLLDSGCDVRSILVESFVWPVARTARRGDDASSEPRESSAPAGLAVGGCLLAPKPGRVPVYAAARIRSSRIAQDHGNCPNMGIDGGARASMALSTSCSTVGDTTRSYRCITERARGRSRSWPASSRQSVVPGPNRILPLQAALLEGCTVRPAAARARGAQSARCSPPQHRRAISQTPDLSPVHAGLARPS